MNSLTENTKRGECFLRPTASQDMMNFNIKSKEENLSLLDRE